jgi:hypothetical protein
MKKIIVGIAGAEGSPAKQKEIASELGWSDTYLRSRLRKHGIKNHEDLLRALRIPGNRKRSIKSRGK